jgi:hypothetical protein
VPLCGQNSLWLLLFGYYLIAVESRNAQKIVLTRKTVVFLRKGARIAIGAVRYHKNTQFQAPAWKHAALMGRFLGRFPNR